MFCHRRVNYVLLWQPHGHPRPGPVPCILPQYCLTIYTVKVSFFTLEKYSKISKYLLIPKTVKKIFENFDEHGVDFEME